MRPVNFSSKFIPEYSGMKLSLEYMERNFNGIIEPLYGPESKEDFDFMDVDIMVEDVEQSINEFVGEKYIAESVKMYLFEGPCGYFSTDDPVFARIFDQQGRNLEAMAASIYLKNSQAIIADLMYKCKDDGDILTPMKPGRVIADVYQLDMESSELIKSFFEEEFPEERFMEY